MLPEVFETTSESKAIENPRAHWFYRFSFSMYLLNSFHVTFFLKPWWIERNYSFLLLHYMSFLGAISTGEEHLHSMCFSGAISTKKEQSVLPLKTRLLIDVKLGLGSVICIGICSSRAISLLLKNLASGLSGSFQDPLVPSWILSMKLCKSFQEQSILRCNLYPLLQRLASALREEDFPFGSTNPREQFVFSTSTLIFSAKLWRFFLVGLLILGSNLSSLLRHLASALSEEDFSFWEYWTQWAICPLYFNT